MSDVEAVVLCEPHWNIVWVGDVSQPGAWPNHCQGGSFIEGAGTWDCRMISKLLADPPAEEKA